LLDIIEWLNKKERELTVEFIRMEFVDALGRNVLNGK
jgi:hypothetical protein